jgi:hypothetical protein
MATALAARECLRDGRDTLYSPQQIWDCSGPTISDSENGTLLQQLIYAMGDVSNVESAYFLVPHACAPVQLPEPSLQRCAQTFSACLAGTMIPPVVTSATFRLSTFDGPSAYGVILAARYMMIEIMQNGPVIGVLVMANLAERIRFETLPRNTVYVPDLEVPLHPTSAVQHCIVVYGWGQDSATSVRFWRVQNSYGMLWSDDGVGRIARGTVERDWRSVSTPPRACLPPASSDTNNISNHHDDSNVSSSSSSSSSSIINSSSSSSSAASATTTTTTSTADVFLNQTTPLPQTHPSSYDAYYPRAAFCIYPPRVGYATTDYDDDDLLPVNANNNNNSSSTQLKPSEQKGHYYYYFPDFGMHDKRFKRLQADDIINMAAPSKKLLAMPNEVILVVTIASSLLIAAIIYAFIRPLRPSQLQQQRKFIERYHPSPFSSYYNNNA